MSVEYLKQQALELEIKILTLIKIFEEDTEMSVSDVSLIKTLTYSSKNSKTVGVNIEVKL